MKWSKVGVSLLLVLVLCSCNYYNIDSIKLEERKHKVEIEFWYGVGGYAGELMKGFISEFNASQEHYYVIGVEQIDYQDTFKALKSSIARKNMPSVVLLENQHMQYLASKGVLLSLGEYERTNNLSDFIESYVDQNKVREELFGVPIFGTTSVLYYRKDFFEQKGIKSVDLLTWESFANVIRKLTQKRESEILVYGWEILPGAKNLIDASISNGGNFISEDGRTVIINSREWIEAWEFFRGLIHDEKVIKTHYGGDARNHWYATVDDVIQGRTAGYIGSCGDLGELDTGVIGTYLLPSWEGKLNHPRGVVNVQSLCVSQYLAEDEKEAVYAWIRYITSEEKSLEWVTQTGFLPVRKSSMDEDAFYNRVLENPDYFIPIRQVKLGTKIFIDPTDGKIYDLLEEAANKLIVDNIAAAEVLEEANENAQILLDELYNKGR